jgi:hypothetical protein
MEERLLVDATQLLGKAVVMHRSSFQQMSYTSSRGGGGGGPIFVAHDSLLQWRERCAAGGRRDASSPLSQDY